MAKSDILVRWKADTQNYDANIAKARRTLEGFAKDNLTAGGAVKQLTSTMTASVAKFASVTAAIGALSTAIKDNVETAKNFEKSMSQLSSLTGMVGDDLDKLKGYAIELGSSTTLSASQVADAFKMIGSQQPQLLESGEALKNVTKQAITLSEAAGIELSTAAQTLSTSINQMGGDSDNAARYVNVLAAASQKGAGDIAWLGGALTQCAAVAKAAGTDYEELVANLEMLAKAGFDASTSGTALKGVIGNLEKQADSQLKPSVVGLTQAFKNLGEKHLTISQYQELLGKNFYAQGMALAQNATEAKGLTQAITDTNTAEEQARINTDNLDGSLKSLASAWEGLNLHINSSNGFLKDCVEWLTEVVRLADQAYQSLSKYINYNPGPRGLEEVGPNVDDNGNFINRPADGNWAGFNPKPAPAPSPAPSHTPAPSTTPRPRGGGKNPKDEPEPTIEGGIKGLQEFAAILTPTTASMNELNTVMKYYKDQLASATTQDQYNSATAGIAATQARIDAQPMALKLGIDEDSMADVLEQLNTISDSIEPIKFKPSGESAKIGKDTAKAWQAAASAVQSVSGALGQLEDPSAKIAGIVGEAIASIALGYATATTQAASMGPWAWIAFAAAGLATMITTVAQIKNVTSGSFAEGGMVKGNTYSNDQIPIMANAGEIVLNRAMAGNLASQLTSGGIGALQLEATISGEDIRLALNNNSLRRGGGEYVTSNFM